MDLRKKRNSGASQPIAMRILGAWGELGDEKSPLQPTRERWHLHLELKGTSSPFPRPSKSASSVALMGNKLCQHSSGTLQYVRTQEHLRSFPPKSKGLPVCYFASEWKWPISFSTTWRLHLIWPIFLDAVLESAHTQMHTHTLHF